MASTRHHQPMCPAAWRGECTAGERVALARHIRHRHGRDLSGGGIAGSWRRGTSAMWSMLDASGRIQNTASGQGPMTRSGDACTRRTTRRHHAFCTAGWIRRHQPARQINIDAWQEVTQQRNCCCERVGKECTHTTHLRQHHGTWHLPWIGSARRVGCMRLAGRMCSAAIEGDATCSSDIECHIHRGGIDPRLSRSLQPLARGDCGGRGEHGHGDQRLPGAFRDPVPRRDAGRIRSDA